MHILYHYLQQQFTAHLLEKRFSTMTLFSRSSPLIDETFAVTSLSNLQDSCCLGARLSNFHLVFKIWFSAGLSHWCYQFWVQVSIGLSYRIWVVGFNLAEPLKQSVISIWSWASYASGGNIVCCSQINQGLPYHRIWKLKETVNATWKNTCRH